MTTFIVVYFRTDQISELQARLEGLQQVHETDGITYKKRLSDMEAEFARTKEQLASENMASDSIKKTSSLKFNEK